MINIVIRKELLSFYRTRSAFWSFVFIVTTTLLITSGMFLILSQVPDFLNTIEETPAEKAQTQQLIETLYKNHPHLEELNLSEDELAQIIIGQLLAKTMLLLPLTIIMSSGALSILSERKEHTLEPLIATPIKTTQLLFGKCLAGTILTLATLWPVAFIFIIVVYTNVRLPEMFWAICSIPWFLLVFLYTPLASHFIVTISCIISSYVRHPRSAQQWAVWTIAPLSYSMFVPFIFGQSLGSNFQTNYIIIAFVALIVLIGLSSFWAIKAFNRQNILAGKH
jgi:ABC-type Na+ efflux pump permease subunit